jgi:hypothetical protein
LSTPSFQSISGYYDDYDYEQEEEEEEYINDPVIDSEAQPQLDLAEFERQQQEKKKALEQLNVRPFLLLYLLLFKYV